MLRTTFIACLAALLLPAADWDRQKAFDYLEARQQQWAEWKPAQKAGGACISCHTGLGFLIARRVLGEHEPRPVEAALVSGVRSRLLSNPQGTMLADPGAEAILGLLTLGLQRRDRQQPVDPAEQAALKRFWEAQVQEGAEKGAWSWFLNDLHPMESDHSIFFGTTLAEFALSGYPAENSARVTAMRTFLQREASQQPLHNRLAWIAFSQPEQAARAAVLRDLWKAQSADGGWSSAALGPWAKRDAAPPDSGSNAYATAWAAFTARQSGVSCGDPGLQRALGWLKTKQDPITGAWHALSMNKVYPPDSMQVKFMADAATGYATAALAGCRPD